MLAAHYSSGFTQKPSASASTRVQPNTGGPPFWASAAAAAAAAAVVVVVQ